MSSHFKFLITAIALAVLLVACSHKDNMNKTASTSYTEPEVAKVVTTVNNAEISMAKRALATSQNQEVRSFAQHMIDDHMRNNMKAKELTAKMDITPEVSAHSKMLMEKNQKSMEKLKNLTGKDFDEAYIKDQIATHEMVLKDLKKSLIPSAKTPELKKQLKLTAKKVEEHLDMAKEVKKTL